MAAKKNVSIVKAAIEVVNSIPARQNVSGESDVSRRRALFEKYGEADKKVEEVKAVLEAALVARSTVVRSIFERFGRGPFKWNGYNNLKVIIRHPTYFFRGKGGDEKVQEV